MVVAVAGGGHPSLNETRVRLTRFDELDATNDNIYSQSAAIESMASQ